MNEVQEHELTKVFRRLYIKKHNDVSHEIEEPKNENTRSISLSPNQLNSTLHEEGEEVDNHFQQQTSRRAIMLQPIRRSKRLNPNGIYSQSIAGSQPDKDKSHASVMSLQLSNLIEGKLISKDELLTKEDDNDYIEDFIDDNLLDELYNIHDIDKKELNKKTIEEHIQSMLSHIEDEELRSKLENVVYKYTNVFSTELSKTTALVEPSSIPLKPNNEWMTDRSKHPPRWQKNNCLKTCEIKKFFRKAIAYNMIRPSDIPVWSQLL